MGPEELDFIALMPEVASALLGQPNQELSRPRKLRYGSRGSLSVDLENGRFYDHERCEGGGVLDLIARETGQKNCAAVKWLRENVLGQPPADPRTAAASPTQRRQIAATYKYEDETGAHLFDVVRFDPKDFRQRAPNGASSTKGIRRVLYRLPSIVTAPAGATVYVCEGEKDVHALEEAGLLATTSPGGAGKWADDYSASLVGKSVVILPDNDDAGRNHADKVLASCRKAGIHSAVLHLAGLPEKGDVVDWLENGGTPAELADLGRQALAAPVLPDGKPSSGFRGIETANAFCQRWQPPAYIVDGILAHGRVQALTAYTGHTKTTTAIHLALCVATGQPFGGHDTEQGAVLILAGENPDLVVGQFRAACLAAGVSPRDLPIYFHFGRFSLRQHADDLLRAARGIDNLAVIIPDTHQAFFEGDNDNDNLQALQAAHKWRPFTELPSKPTVLVPCHPSGKKPERDNLVPRGGSAFMNELDGNFCLWRKGDVVTFHWQGKHRGPSFEPVELKLDLRTHLEIVDSKGREIPMPVVRPLLTTERMAAEREALDTDLLALVTIRERPDITVRELAAAIRRGKSSAGEIINTLKADGLIHKHARKWKLTSAGQEVLEDVGL